jgi:hypothetical protein
VLPSAIKITIHAPELRWKWEEAGLEPIFSAVNCARAMDRLKHLIALPNASEKHAWKQMRDVLQIDERYLKFIT